MIPLPMRWMACLVVILFGSLPLPVFADALSPEFAYPVYPNMPNDPQQSSANRSVGMASTPLSLSTYLQSKLIGMSNVVSAGDQQRRCIGVKLNRVNRGYTLSCMVPNEGVITAELVFSGRLGDAPTSARLGMVNQAIKAKKAMATYEARESVAIQGLFGENVSAESNLQRNINDVPDSTLPTASHAELLQVWDIGTQQSLLQSVIVVQNQLFTNSLVPLVLTLEFRE